MNFELVITRIAENAGILLASGVIAALVSAIFNLWRDRNQFRHERVMESYRIYVDKKHIAYTEYWQLLIKAASLVNSQRGSKTMPDIYTMDSDGVEKLLNDLPIQIENKRKTHLLDQFSAAQVARNGMDEVRNQIYDLLGEIEILRSKRAVQEAKNLYVLNQLYFPDELCQMIDELHQLLFRVTIRREEPSADIEGRKKDMKDDVNDLEKVETLINQTMKKMRAEISVQKGKLYD